MKRVWSLIALSLLLVAGIAMPASSQESCPGVVIDDTQTSHKLDREWLCEAAQPWTDSFQVYIFLTDEVPVNEDQWFSIIDAFEEEQGIYDPSSGGFVKTAISFEASTMDRNTFAANIAIGEALENTALWDDVTRDRLKGQFRNNLNTGVYTTAFSDIITKSYQTAFPAAVQVATQQPQATQPVQSTSVAATTAPVSTVAPLATTVPQTQRESSESSQSTLGVIGILVVGIVIVGVSGVITIEVVVPRMARRREERKFLSHINDLRRRISPLLLAGEELLSGRSPSDTQLYSMWSALGGNEYAEREATVLRLIQRAQDAFNLANEKFTELNSEESKDALEEQVRKWEILYLTLVGTTDEVTSLTAQQQEDLLNPLHVVEQEDINNDELYKQLVDAFRSGNEETLHAQMYLVQPGDFEADGILGSVAGVKNEMAILKHAADKAPQAYIGAETALQNALAHHSFPENLPAAQALEALFKKFEEAGVALNNGLFLDVLDMSDQIMNGVNEVVPGLVQDYVKAQEGVAHSKAVLAELERDGFNLSAIEPILVEVEQDIQTFTSALQSGDYAKAREFVEEISTDSQRALKTARRQAELRNANSEALTRLIAELGVAQVVFEREVTPTFKSLQEYPEANWGEAAEAYSSAQAILKSLPDNPADEKDIISRIRTLNSFEQQNFAEAEQIIQEAFGQLASVRLHFETILGQLKLVQKMEQEVEANIAEAESAVAQAETARAQNDTMVGTNVDTLIQSAHADLEKARQQSADRSFVTAMQMAQSARTNALQATESANEQIKAIQALLNEMPGLALHAKTKIAETAQTLRSLPASLLAEASDHDLENANRQLRQAESLGASTTGKSDQEWLDILTQQKAAYLSVISIADTAATAIYKVEQEYLGHLKTAKEAISQAEEAIRDARRLVSHDDANGVGSNALQRAQNTLPEEPTFGTAVEAVRRIKQQAQQAETYANQAGEEASKAIRAVEAERTRQATILLERERERQRQQQQRQDEIDRDRRRQQPTTPMRMPDFGSTRRSDSKPSGGSSSPFGGSRNSGMKAGGGSSFGSRSTRSSLGTRSNSSSMGTRKR